MVTSLFGFSDFSAAFWNNRLRSCFILMLAASASGASPPTVQQGHMTTVVRADLKTGRLIRSVVLEPRVADLPPGEDLSHMIDSIADEQGVESPLVHSVIRAESNYNANAVSLKGAQGMMQLIPATARRFGVSDTFDARQNVQGGVRYLRYLLDYYQGDYSRAIAAYNAGEGAVDKYHGIPPYTETQNYVVRVAKNLKTAREEHAQSAASAHADAGVNSETSKSIETSSIQTVLGSDGRVYYRTP
jgi:hypothetical protein